jgi:hypothetical protein
MISEAYRKRFFREDRFVEELDNLTFGNLPVSPSGLKPIA